MTRVQSWDYKTKQAVLLLIIVVLVLVCAFILAQANLSKDARRAEGVTHTVRRTTMPTTENIEQYYDDKDANGITLPYRHHARYHNEQNDGSSYGWWNADSSDQTTYAWTTQYNWGNQQNNDSSYDWDGGNWWQ